MGFLGLDLSNLNTRLDSRSGEAYCSVSWKTDVTNYTLIRI